MDCDRPQRDEDSLTPGHDILPRPAGLAKQLARTVETAVRPGQATRAMTHFRYSPSRQLALTG
jgi:hypothetical protein